MSKIKNEKIDFSAAIDKCDMIGGNKLILQRKLASIKTTWMSTEENVKQINDFIFGISDENPFEDANKELENKFDDYDDRLINLVQKVKASKLKRKINK